MAFLAHLATADRVAASTQNQALNALVFLYRQVLGVERPPIEDAVRARKPARLPTVFTRAEVQTVLAELEGVPHLVAGLLSGSGLRLLEALRLRVKDLDCYDIRTVQKLLGHSDVRTTMVYTHVLNRGGRGVKSPLDAAPA